MLRYYLTLAWQRACKGPWITALIVLTMAVGIAACMTALTVSHALSGEPLPGLSEHLYIASVDGCGDVACEHSEAAWPSLLGLRDARTLVDKAPAQDIAALAQALASFSAEQRSVPGQTVRGLMAYGQLLRLLGVTMRFGRGWTPSETAAAAPVVVIDAPLAQQLFGRADAVGRSVRIDGHAFRVIGVSAPWSPRIQFLDVSRNSADVSGVRQRFFMPVPSALQAGLGPSKSGVCEGGVPQTRFGSTALQHCLWLDIWAQLPTAEAHARFMAWLQNFADQQHAAGRFLKHAPVHAYRAARWVSLNHVVPSQVGMNTLIAVGLLVLCIINVAGLLAARFLRRRGDIGVRRALGATRRSIFVQHLFESLGLGLAAGALALPLTLLGLWLVRMQPVSYARMAQMQPDTFVGLLLVSLLVGASVGLLPAWRMCRLSPAVQIKSA